MSPTPCLGFLSIRYCERTTSRRTLALVFNTARHVGKTHHSRRPRLLILGIRLVEQWAPSGVMSSYPNALPHWNDPVHGSLQSHKKPVNSSSTASASTSSRVRHPGLASAAPNVIPMSPQAFDNNAKLFPVFEAHLSDAKYGGNYQPSAEKFAGWLSRDKAYYTTARPWVSDTMQSELDCH